jgi:hypothetical protein
VCTRGSEVHDQRNLTGSTAGSFAEREVAVWAFAGTMLPLR